MTGCNWHNYGPFEPGIRISERGERVHALIKACRGIPGTHEALCLLGAPHDPARRAKAQAILDGLPTRDLRKALSRYGLEALPRRKGAAA